MLDFIPYLSVEPIRPVRGSHDTLKAEAPRIENASPVSDHTYRTHRYSNIRLATVAIQAFPVWPSKTYAKKEMPSGLVCSCKFQDSTGVTYVGRFTYVRHH